MCSSWGHSLKPFLGALSTQQSLNGVGEGEMGRRGGLGPSLRLLSEQMHKMFL